MSGERGVWEVVTGDGGRHLVHLTDGVVLSFDGGWFVSTPGWRTIVRRDPIVIGRPALVWVDDNALLDLGEVSAWRPLPDRVLLDDGGVVVSNGVIRRVHSAHLCAPRDSCWIHRPSPHLIRNLPIHWRDDNGTAERVCRHGIGHPDPDDVAFRRARGQRHADVHGCDGCCAPAARPDPGVPDRPGPPTSDSRPSPIAIRVTPRVRVP